VLVTGGAGYLGAVLVPRLLAAGFRVTVLDDLRHGQPALRDVACDPGLDFRRGDARDDRELRPLLARADAVVPLACVTGAPACDRDPVEARSVIVDAAEALLRLRSPAQPVLFPGTESVYGAAGSSAVCDERTPPRPASLYARLKLETERRVLEAEGTVSLRLATAFGASPRLRLDLLLNDFTWRARTQGSITLFEPGARRSFVHVRDAAEAFLHVLQHPEARAARCLNVCLDGVHPTKEELCARIARHVPGFTWTLDAAGADPDRRDYAVSPARLTATGFRARRDLDAGIREILRLADAHAASAADPA